MPKYSTFEQSVYGTCPECGAKIEIQRRRYKRVDKQWTHWYFARCERLKACPKENGQRLFTEREALMDFLM